MKRISTIGNGADCIKDNSLIFEYKGSCFSISDLFAFKEETLSILNDLTKKVQTLENKIKITETVSYDVYVFKDRIAKKITQLHDYRLRPTNGWTPLGWNGWYWRQKRYRRYFTQFDYTPYNKFLKRSPVMWREEDFYRDFNPPFSKDRINTNKPLISFEKWLKIIKQYGKG